MTDPSQTEAERLSKLLFEAREQIAMWADVVASRSNSDTAARYPRSIVDQIDQYRAERGWSPHGFGGESAQPTIHPLARPTDGNTI